MNEVMKKKELVDCVLATFDNMSEVERAELTGFVLGYVTASSDKRKAS